MRATLRRRQLNLKYIFARRKRTIIARMRDKTTTIAPQTRKIATRSCVTLFLGGAIVYVEWG